MACLFCSYPCLVCLAGAVSQAIPIIKRKGLAWSWPRTISCSAFRAERCGKDLARATWSQMGDFQRKHLTAQLLLGLLYGVNCNAVTHATFRDGASCVYVSNAALGKCETSKSGPSMLEDPYASTTVASLNVPSSQHPKTFLPRNATVSDMNLLQFPGTTALDILLTFVFFLLFMLFLLNM